MTASISDPFVVCLTCSRPKRPHCRYVTAEEAPGFCDFDCDGYEDDPQPSTLWPGEADEEEAWWNEHKGEL